MNETKSFLEEHNRRAQALFKKMTLAYWRAMASGSQEDYKRSEEAQLERKRLYSSKADFEKVKRWREAEVTDELVKRELDVLYLMYLESQGDQELQKEIVTKSSQLEREFNTFRVRLRGKELTDNEVLKILEEETDSELLKEAWEETKKQGALVAGKVVELVKLRNKLSQSLGFKNYFAMALSLSEETEEELAAFFDELDGFTREPFMKLKDEIDALLAKRLGVQAAELKPWHYQGRFFQEAPKAYSVNLDGYYTKDIQLIVKDFYASIKLPVDSILSSSDLHERKGKYQHAYCLSVDMEKDVRIMESIKQNDYWLETTLHELGHGVHFYYADSSLAFELRSPHTLVTEAIAQLFGRQEKTAEFLKRYGDITEEKAEELRASMQQGLRARQLVFSRWCQVLFHFEQGMYADPDQNLNLLWWSLVKKYQSIDFSRDLPDWASKIHLALYPAYYHNYMLGEVFASQLHKRICALLHTDMHHAEYRGNPVVGEFLRSKVFVLGGKLSWNDLVEYSTGERLTSKYYAEQFATEH